MTRYPFLLIGLVLALSGPVAGATAREIDATELRKLVSVGDTISLKTVVASVAASTQAEPIEARAFDVDGIYYRIVLKQVDGTVISVIIDAATGRQVKASSAIGKQVREAAGKSEGKGTKGKSGTAGGGNGNAGGNGGGNGNGGGGGNGGGNGGGGGNGKGGG